MCNVASVVKPTQERTSSKHKAGKKKSPVPNKDEDQMVTLNLMSSRDTTEMMSIHKHGGIELNPSHFGCLNITSIKKQHDSKESFADYATLGQCPKCATLEKQKVELEKEIEIYKKKSEDWKKQ